MTVLLHANDLSVSGPTSSVENLSLTSNGSQVGCFGQWDAVFSLFAGQGSASHGQLTVLGVPAEQAVRRGVLGIADSETPLPQRLRVVDYLELKAQLLGRSRRDARQGTRNSLRLLRLEKLSARRCCSLNAVEQRAIKLAGAIVTQPPVLATSQLLSDLPQSARSWLMGVFELGATERKIIHWARASTPSGPAPWLSRSSEVLWLRNGELIFRGAGPELYGPTTRYLLNVKHGGTALARSLEAQGCQLHTTAPIAPDAGNELAPSQTSATASTSGEATENSENSGNSNESGRWLVQLPAGSSTRLVLDAAELSGALVLEMIPLTLYEAPRPKP